MTRIALIRHGITAWNKAGRAQGSSDIPLDAEGFQQAGKIGERLGKGDWDMIFASDLTRARQTAETIQRQLEAVPLKLDVRLQEVSVGQAEGTTWDERIAKWGKNWRELDLDRETHENVLERGFSFLDDVTQKHEGENIIVVSHGSIIRRILGELFMDIEMETTLGNCSLTIMRKAHDTWEMDVHNDTKHL